MYVAATSATVGSMSEPNEALLNEHLAAENAHDLDGIMATYTATPVIELNGSRILELEPTV
jgi:hypothetical protein